VRDRSWSLKSLRVGSTRAAGDFRIFLPDYRSELRVSSIASIISTKFRGWSNVAGIFTFATSVECDDARSRILYDHGVFWLQSGVLRPPKQSSVARPVGFPEIVGESGERSGFRSRSSMRFRRPAWVLSRESYQGRAGRDPSQRSLVNSSSPRYRPRRRTGWPGSDRQIQFSFLVATWTASEPRGWIDRTLPKLAWWCIRSAPIYTESMPADDVICVC